MSMCDVCLRPGNCCRDVFLSGNSVDGRSYAEPDNPYAAFHLPMSFEAAEHMALRNRMPFRPLVQQDDGTWRWWCTNLNLSTGRCNDYENRPDLCRRYRPGQDGMCVHYWEDPRGEVDGVLNSAEA